MLDLDRIEFDVRADGVFVRPVRSVAGGLATYARKYRPVAEAREAAWKEVAHGKAKVRSS